MNLSELRLFSKVLCEHSKSKSVAGRVLDLITQSDKLDLEQASELLYDIVTMDFFYEIPGDMNSFLAQFGRAEEENKKPGLKERVIELLEENYRRNETTGDLIESDEDSEGNLK
jgi:hypothetical protein